MPEETKQSVVEMSIGDNDVHIEGSEDFVSDQLSTVLDEIDFNSLHTPTSGMLKNQEDGGDNEANNETTTGSDEEVEDHSELAEVARSLNVEPGKLRRYALRKQVVDISVRVSTQPENRCLSR